MLRRLSPIVLWLLALALPRLAAAQVTPAAGYTPPDDTQKIGIGAVIYANYTFQQTPQVADASGNTVSKNSFDTVRTYINITGQVSHVVSFRITPDISRETGNGASLAGSLEYRLKYGFVQLNLDDWMGSWNGSWARLGIQQNVIIDYEEGIYRYRFQGTTFLERVGVLASSDAGVTFHANIPNNMGDFHVGVYNGEGYAKAEVNNQKAVMIRATVRPFGQGPTVARGLRITGFYDDDHYIKDGPRQRAAVEASFEHTHFNAGFDYVAAKDQTTAAATLVKSKGWSVFITPFFKAKGSGPEALVRYDWFKPNDAVAATQRRLIAGIAYWFPHPAGPATTCLLLDLDQLKTTGAATNNSIALHALVNF